MRTAILTARARELRRGMTSAERLLWSHLRNDRLGVHFRRQEPVDPFITDFICRTRALVVELDGRQHVERVLEDALRTQRLNREGLRVIRFWNREVLTNLHGVLNVIVQAL